MARIAGVDIPRDKRVVISLTYIYGIGKPTAQKILKNVGISEDVRVKDLTEDEIEELFEESIILPTQYEINEYQMMIDFIETVESPEINNNLQRLIQGKGAFRRFKDYCAEMNIIQEWYDFRDKKYKEIAIYWCKQNELEYK